MKTDLSIIEYVRQFEMTLVGSRRLQVDTPESDYDYAVYIPQDKLKEMEIIYNSDTKFPQILNYFSVLPLGNSVIIKCIADHIKIDCIVFTNKEDYDVICKVYDQLSRLPKILVEQKSMRIKLVEILLQENGWIHNNPPNDHDICF